MSVRAWQSMFTQTIRVSPYTGVDGYGKASYGQAVDYRARVVGRMRMARDVSGKEVVSTQTVYLQSNDAIDPKDKVTLSTGDVGSTDPVRINPPLIGVGRFPDEQGQLYTTLYLA